jgi:hypothetical protein
MFRQLTCPRQLEHGHSDQARNGALPEMEVQEQEEGLLDEQEQIHQTSRRQKRSHIEIIHPLHGKKYYKE